jgi:hypothetical protein
LITKKQPRVPLFLFLIDQTEFLTETLAHFDPCYFAPIPHALCFLVLCACLIIVVCVDNRHECFTQKGNDVPFVSRQIGPL